MEKTLIEVFIEDDCPTCREVVDKLRRLASGGMFVLEVFRKDDGGAFDGDRHVATCPATFVNRQPAFYGDFTLGELRNFVFRHQRITED